MRAKNEIAEQYRIVDYTDVVVHWAEVGAAIVLALLAVAGVVGLVVQVALSFRAPSLEALSTLFGTILLVFILLELYGISTAFLKRLDVTDKVFEVGLVALVREVIVAEFLHLGSTELLTIASLILALGIAWYLSRRAEAQPHIGSSTERAEERGR